MRTAILARHGETTLNVQGLVNGDLSVACPLTGRGEEQSRRLGELLAGDRIDLCVTSEFVRARRTAELALDGLDVPRLVLPELNDPLYGRFEGGPLETYRYWAGSAASGDTPGGGGESRIAIVQRYVRGFRAVRARPEETVLVVCHSLPVAYALDARAGRVPARRVALVDSAFPYWFAAEEVSAAVDVLAGWTAAPTW
jgi:broad specificity phosphatase PhoE